MKKVTLLLSLFSFVFLSVVNAQPPCGFDRVHNNLLAADPDYARQVAEGSRFIREYIERHPVQPGTSNRVNALYTIPVVVHVMHTGGAVGTIYNPTDAQIQGAINYLNQVFAGTYPGMQEPVEGGGVVDMEIQFALAQRTPSCGTTNGIDRVDMSGNATYVANGVNNANVTGISDLALKNSARWTPADYYNIWVVNKIDGADGTSGQFVAGYAYFAGASAQLDGTVMLATQMVAGEKTLPHEIGHALNLHHTFNGSANSASCPPLSPCTTTGDEVCDTDPVSNNVTSGVYNFACRTGTNPCATPNVYTRNTESNFMAYTFCYTLFTNGQKARAQAAMALPSRASLVAPSNLALSPCGTVINFTTATSSRAEDATGSVTGCRTYRDYTYNMSIGAAPTATATVTLSFSGTATRGLDYDVTTNGNFTTPSTTLTFNAGATTQQTLTVRIYDDGAVEGSESIILDFTVNNGGGDAVKGTLIPTLTITLPDNDVAPVGAASGLTAIGTYAGYIEVGPFDSRLSAQRGQYLYRASELAAAGISAGNITALQLFIDAKQSSRPFNGFTIRMGQVALNNLVDGGVSVAGGLTQVYSNSSLSTAAGWNNFTFSTPFNWNGTSSIVFEICYDNTLPDGAQLPDRVGAYLDGGSATQGNMFWQNNINCATGFSSVNYYNNGIKPIIRLNTVSTGTAIETVAGSSSSLHFAVGSSDYIYSTNNRLMARINNLSAPLNCVTAQVQNGGSTWQPFLGGERSAKVFAITPTTNSATANYTLSLYYTVAELGGKNPANLRIAKTSALTAGDATNANSVVVTPTVTTLGTGTVVFTAPFTGFSRFFLVDAAVTLPIELVSFTGRPDGANTLLKWATAWEENNREFEIEASADASTFTRLGTVPTQGNGTSGHTYNYVHVAPPPGTTWYRLRQVDNDGRSTYSPVISVTHAQALTKAYLFPVPAKESVTVNFGSALTNATVELFSTYMKLLHREKLTGSRNRYDLPLTGRAAGLYFVRITGGNEPVTLQLLKQ